MFFNFFVLILASFGTISSGFAGQSNSVPKPTDRYSKIDVESPCVDDSSCNDLNNQLYSSETPDVAWVGGASPKETIQATKKKKVVTDAGLVLKGHFLFKGAFGEFHYKEIPVGDGCYPNWVSNEIKILNRMTNDNVIVHAECSDKIEKKCGIQYVRYEGGYEGADGHVGDLIVPTNVCDSYPADAKILLTITVLPTPEQAAQVANNASVSKPAANDSASAAATPALNQIKSLSVPPQTMCPVGYECIPKNGSAANRAQ